MKQHSTPQRKYATGEKRNGLTGSVLLAVAFLLGCIIGCGFFSPWSVQAAQSNQLPSIEMSVPVYTGKEDMCLQQTETAIGKEIARIRQIQGLGTVSVSDVLSKNASYIATAMLTRNDATTALSKAQSLSSQLSYITVSAAIYAEDYYCTQPALGAEYFCKMVLNHTNSANAILKNDIQVVGIALVRGEFDGKTVTCGVICAAKNQITQAQSLIPADILAKDTQAPAVESKKVFVAAGTALTDAHIKEALIVHDERGQTPSITYDLTQVDTQTEGEKTLSVKVADPAGNTATCTVTIQVATPTLPMILTETLLLPEISEGELWDLAKYVQASDQYGIASVQTKPMFLRPAQITEGLTVSVTVTNVYGLTKTVQLPVAKQSVSYHPVAQDFQGAGLTVGVPAGEELRVDSHISLQCNALEKGTYHFTVENAQGTQSTVVREQNTLVWNPGDCGETKVSVVIYNEHGGVYQTSELNIVVADKQIFVYNTLVLSFVPESQVTLNHQKLWIYGIKPGMTVAQLKAAAKVTGSDGEITFSCVDVDGNVLKDTALVPCGSVMSILEDGELRGTYTVIIYGDTNGDGKISVADYVKVRQELLRGNMISGTFVYAADVNGDGKISVADYVKIRQHLLGRLEIVQK